MVPLVCSEAIVGDGSLPSAGVVVRLRLVVSPVKPSLTQVGAEELVAFKTVCASSDVLAPKNASPPPPSPKAPHSVVFQDAARSTTLSLLETRVACPEPTVSDTESLPPDVALPASLMWASCRALSG